jgi:hypothetical protein
MLDFVRKSCGIKFLWMAMLWLKVLCLGSDWFAFLLPDKNCQTRILGKFFHKTAVFRPFEYKCARLSALTCFPLIGILWVVALRLSTCFRGFWCRFPDINSAVLFRSWAHLTDVCFNNALIRWHCFGGDYFLISIILRISVYGLFGQWDGFYSFDDFHLVFDINAGCIVIINLTLLKRAISRVESFPRFCICKRF